MDFIVGGPARGKNNCLRLGNASLSARWSEVLSREDDRMTGPVGPALLESGSGTRGVSASAFGASGLGTGVADKSRIAGQKTVQKAGNCP